MGNRRVAIPAPRISPSSIEARLAGAPIAQYHQTGVRNSTNDGFFVNLNVSGTASILNLGVGSSFTVQSSALKSMAFQSSTGVSISGGLFAGVQSTNTNISGSTWAGGAIGTAVISNSSINATPIGTSTPSTGRFSELYSTSTAALNSILSTAVTLSGGTIDNTKVGLTTPSSGKFTDLTVTGTISFGTFVSDVVAAILGYVTIQTSTGGTVRLAAVST